MFVYSILQFYLSEREAETQARRGGEGVLGISSDRDDRMEPKVKTQKNP